jgi:hypothetical protein
MAKLSMRESSEQPFKVGASIPFGAQCPKGKGFMMNCRAEYLLSGAYLHRGLPESDVYHWAKGDRFCRPNIKWLEIKEEKEEV